MQCALCTFHSVHSAPRLHGSVHALCTIVVLLADVFVLCVLFITSFSSNADEWQALLFTCFHAEWDPFSVSFSMLNTTCALVHNSWQCTFHGAMIHVYIMLTHVTPVLQTCSSTAIHTYTGECTCACDNHLLFCTCVNILLM